MTKFEKANEVVQSKIDHNLSLIASLEQQNKQLKRTIWAAQSHQRKTITLYEYNSATAKLKENEQRIVMLTQEIEAYRKVLSVFVELSRNEDFE